jgi:hypothetical protein
MSMGALILALGMILSLGTIGQFTVWAGHADVATGLAAAYDHNQQRAGVFGPRDKVFQSSVNGCTDFSHNGACSFETAVRLAMLALGNRTFKRQLADLHFRPLRPSLIDGHFRQPISTL